MRIPTEVQGIEKLKLVIADYLIKSMDPKQREAFLKEQGRSPVENDSKLESLDASVTELCSLDDLNMFYDQPKVRTQVPIKLGKRPEIQQAVKEKRGRKNDVWSEEDREKFVTAVGMFGKKWEKVTEFVGNKTSMQISSHAQNYFRKIAKHHKV